MGFGIIELLFSLIVLGLSYIVLHLASKAEGGLKLLGKIIGRIMIVISMIVIIIILYIYAMIIFRSVTGNRPQMAQQERVVKPAPAPRAPGK